MKTGKKSDKHEKFIELFSTPFQSIKTNSTVPSSEKIIKHTQSTESGIVRKIEVPTESHEPSIFYYEVDGRVESIEFQCTCGNKIKVRLKYDPSSSDQK